MLWNHNEKEQNNFESNSIWNEQWRRWTMSSSISLFRFEFAPNRRVELSEWQDEKEEETHICNLCDDDGGDGGNSSRSNGGGSEDNGSDAQIVRSM